MIIMHLCTEVTNERKKMYVHMSDQHVLPLIY